MNTGFEDEYSFVCFKHTVDMPLFLKYVLIFTDFRFLKFKNKGISTVIKLSLHKTTKNFKR